MTTVAAAETLSVEIRGARLDLKLVKPPFVELKKAHVGEDAKVPHLSYIGDAEIGEGTNEVQRMVIARHLGL